MSSQNNESIGWKHGLLYVILMSAFVGGGTFDRPVRNPWWHQYAVNAAIWAVWVIASRMILRTTTLVRAIGQALATGIVMGAVLLLPWWGMFLSAAAIVAVGYILHERKAARGTKQEEDSRS